MTAAELKNLFRSTLVAQRTIAQEYTTLDAIVDFISQALTSGIADWTNALTFQTDGTDAGTFCIWPDTDGNIRFWKTKVDDNINNEPPDNPLTTEDTYWIEVSPSDGSAIKEWSAGVYGDGLVIVYHDHSTDGPGLYKLEEPVRPFESTNIETEITAGEWIAIVSQGNTWGGLWNFAGNGGDFPTAIKAGKLYVAEDDHGAPGDADYVAAGTWMASKVAGADAFNEYYYK